MEGRKGPGRGIVFSEASGEAGEEHEKNMKRLGRI